MRKNFFVSSDINVKKAVALFIVTAIVCCALPLSSVNLTASANDNNTADIAEIFAVGNGIYLGEYRHVTGVDVENTVVTRERSASPILWQVVSIEGNNATLASVYVLDMADKNYMSYLNANSFLSNVNSTFSTQEEDLITSVSVISDTAALGNIKAPLKNGNAAISWWLEDGYYIDAEGKSSNYPDMYNSLHGFRPAITIDLATAGLTVAHATPEEGTRKYNLTYMNELNGSDLIKSEISDGATHMATGPLTTSESLVAAEPFSSTGNKPGNSGDSNNSKNSGNNIISGLNETRTFGIVVDYVDEVIRLISANDVEGNRVEAGDKEVSDYYKDLAEMFYSGDTVEYMYALKVLPDSSISSDKKTKTFLAEKWYPIYGNTIDISKSLPKSNKKAFYIAIRRAEDVFDSEKGYLSRQVVPLKARNPDSQFKKQIVYNPDKEMFVLSSGEINVIYRMNYFTTLVEAKLTTTNGISVPSHIYPLGGVLYVSAMPVTNSNGEVTMAASNPVKISVPKRTTAPSVKVDLSSKKITSLKKSTMEYSYDGKENWTTYTGNSTSLELKNLHSHFSNITLSDDDNYIIYVRTKATAKSPASESKKLVIPKSFVDVPDGLPSENSES